ncbi:hypothetical protein SSX86_027293 [Deinandra increscens subsp. villosa]|uniref:No apical meristem-associated C-terminal domain-containing protein n=1 Tax=Deinandra increscens subsp. villosa TaxID=3103831 RepID=A0AAP0GMY8_9ASTR
MNPNNPNQGDSSNPNTPLNNPNLQPWHMPMFAGQPNPLYNPSFAANYAQWGNQGFSQQFQSQPIFSPQQQQQQPPPMEEDDDLEIVPETQVSERARRGRGKGKQVPEGFEEADGRVSWTTPEELALVRAYIDTSEDPRYGNAQTFKAFWDRISVKYHEAMSRAAQPGEKPLYRNNDKLSGKWSQIKKKVSKFHAVYVGVDRTRKSGMCDADVVKIAVARYKDDGHKGAPPIQHYEIMKPSPKFNEMLEGTALSKKRSSTDMDSPRGSYSTARTNINLNDEINTEEGGETDTTNLTPEEREMIKIEKAEIMRELRGEGGSGGSGGSDD